MERLAEGLYERLVDRRLQEALHQLEAEGWLAELKALEPGDSHHFLAKHLAKHLESALRSFDGEDKLRCQVSLCNSILRTVLQESDNTHLSPDELIDRAEQLLALEQKVPEQNSSRLERPDSPLSQGCLLTGTRLDPSLVSQLQKEIASADEIDILCSFIRWSGIRILTDALQTFTSRAGARLRIITTSYMGATDLKAIDFLAQLPNTDLKVSYDTHRTRLHAKAYLFRRHTGYGTTYIGSANLSRAALTEGLEWTLKVSQVEQGYLFERVQGTFETYWNDREFITYTAAERPVLERALASERTPKEDAEGDTLLFDLEPFTFQREILEKLEAERQLQGRHRHLVVAATGTGKTMIAAFDFRQWRRQLRKADPNASPRLLFVAHREEILKQSQTVFRHVLRDANFGELMVGGREPEGMDHLFISIQTWISRQLHKEIAPDYYDYVVIDEFHHAAADSYQQLLDHLRPQVMLGLTATPERADGMDVLHRFDDHISAEIRLPDAINRKLLSPFQYFCITDNVDLSGLRWQRGGYQVSELENVYTGNDLRAGLVIDKVRETVTSVPSTRGIGFCVSQAHAHYMSRKFNQAHIPSEALDANSPADIRHRVQGRLRKREINFIFVVDLYNEGVDIPEVDTVLFLRPTESLTVFLQQLGRGLRLSDDKECLTVLDFVGRAHQNYRFDTKFRSLLAPGHERLDQEIEGGFPHLPAGCSIQLEKVARQYILENIRQSLRMSRPQLVQRVRNFEGETGRALTMRGFLNYYDMELDDIYRKTTWSRLLSDTGKGPALTDPDEKVLTKGLRRLEHTNDPHQIRRLQQLLTHPVNQVESSMDEADKRRLLMLHQSLWESGWQPQSLAESLDRLDRNPLLKQELLDLLSIRLENIESAAPELDLPFLCPLHLHALYTRDEILAGLGH